MVITLKNGKNIKLEWNFLVMEYLDEYTNGELTGYAAIQKDIKEKKNSMKINNIFVYALIASAYPEVLTYKETLTLIEFKDINKIYNFIQQNMNQLDSFKKKDQKHITQKSWMK